MYLTDLFMLVLIVVPFQEAGRLRVNLRQYVHELIKVARDRRLKFPEGPLRDAVDEITQVARARLCILSLKHNNLSASALWDVV